MRYGIQQHPPPPGVPINRHHPILAKCGSLWDLREGLQARNIIRPDLSSTVQGKSGFTITPQGLKFDGTSTYIQCNYPSTWTSADVDLTLVCNFRYANTGASSSRMLIGAVSGWWGPVYLQFDATNGRFEFKIYGWSGQHYSIYSANNILKWNKNYCVIGTYDSATSTMKLFFDGRMVATGTTNGSSWAAGGSIPYIGLGYYLNAGAAAGFLNSWIAYAGFWYNAKLSDGEAVSLSSDPFQIYHRTFDLRRYVATGGGAAPGYGKRRLNLVG